MISRSPTGLRSRYSSHHSVTDTPMFFRIYTHGEIASESIFILTDTFNMCHPSYESMSEHPYVKSSYSLLDRGMACRWFEHTQDDPRIRKLLCDLLGMMHSPPG